MFRVVLASVFGLILCSSTLAHAAVHWGDLKHEGCPKKGFRQLSSILWDIPWGQSWEQTCWATPEATTGRVPDRCVNDGLHIYGQWDVLDSTCP
jgi:hypothetical protein